MSGRTLRDVPLERYFRPDVVAFVGLSATKGHPSRLLYKTIANRIAEHGGVVHPVNPKFTEIDGTPCFARVVDVPGPIDLTVITVSDALAVLDDVLASSTRFVMIFGAGYSESGDAGRRRQEELAAKIGASSAYLLGPNTTLNSFLPRRARLEDRRSIALISHSGHQGRHIWQAEDLGIPLAYWAPTGNEVDLELADFAKYFAEQPEVGAIAAYVEGFRDGTTLRYAADLALRRGVPIVMCLVGRTEVGRSSAMTHTAHLAGSDAVAAAVLRQFGIQRVDTIDELLYVSAMFTRAAAPSGPGACVYSISGGSLTHLSDLLQANGVDVPELTAATQARLGELIPHHLRVTNPVDSGGRPSGDERGRQIIEAILADPNVGVLIVPFVADAHQLSDRVVDDVIDAARTSDKPICVVWGSPTATEPAYQTLIADPRVITFRTFGQAVRALTAYFDYHDVRSRYTPLTEITPPAVSTDLPDDGATVLSEHRSKELLARYGIPVSVDRLARDRAGAGAAAAEIDGPLVLKVSSPDIAHKSDHGLVALGIERGDVGARFDELIERAHAVAPDARIDGVLVCETVEPGIETIIGVQRDPVFGPVVMVGIGGVLVEVLDDVAFRVPPFTRRQAREMLAELRAARLFDGVRGRGPADIEGVVDAIMGLQAMVLDLGDRIAEVDVNPLIVTEHRAIAVDALVRLG